MVNCEGCGAGISESDDVCPYCGHSIRKRADVRMGDRPHAATRDHVEIHTSDRTYRAEEDADGMTTIRFGDGQSGRRLPSGQDGVTSQYRAGAGSSGNISANLMVKLDELHGLIKKVPKPTKGSKDTGVLLLETIAVMDDLLSFYQDEIAKDAYLDTGVRKRVSKKENTIKPKLKELVRFCEKVDPRSMGQMGLSSSDIQKIKTTATKSLRMIESALCERCGAMNTPTSSKCRKCGRSL